MKKEHHQPWWALVLANIASSIVSFILFFIGAFVILGIIIGISMGEVQSGNVAIIPIEGVITTEGGSGLLSSNSAVSGIIVKQIERAEKDDGIKAILFEINSPGGTPVASDEIAQAIKRAEKPTVAVIREAGASGAYWIASATDHIIANRMSVTGSVGVLGSGLEFGEFLDEHNVTYRRIVGGKYKDVGTPLRTSTLEERALLQSTIDKIHNIFIEEVQTNRKLSDTVMRQVREGYIYLGIEALDLGLVDELGGQSEAQDYLEGLLGEDVSFSRYSSSSSFAALFGEVVSLASFRLGEGMTDHLTAESTTLATV